MTQDFDVYRKWLGIPAEEQPPNHYRLLGVGLFETDADVIANAADRQMAHVRTFQTGKHSALSQRLLNELAAARITLLDAKRRAAYDVNLRTQLTASMPPTKVAPAVNPPPFFDPTFDEEAEADDPLDLSSATFSPSIGATSYAARRKKRSMQGPMIATGVAVGTLLLLVWLVLSGTLEKLLPADSPQDPSHAASNDASSRGPNAQATTARSKEPVAPVEKRQPAASPPGATATKPPAFPPVAPKLVQKPLPQGQGAELRGGPSVDTANMPDSQPTASEPADIRLPDDPEGREKSPPAKAFRRLPVPDEAARSKAEETIRGSLFRRDFEATDRSSKREALAKKLFDEGLRMQDDLPATFVFLKLACAEAAAAGDIETTFAAIEALTERFDIAAIELKVDAFEVLVKAPKLGAAQRILLANRILEMASEAVEADRYDLADRAVAQARPLIAKTRDAALLKEISARTKTVQEAKQAYEQIEQALKTLESSPDDSAANETVGRYYCFAKGNWQRGLKHLAKAENEELKRLAQTDVAAPTDNSARLSLGDGWWDLAEKNGGTARQQIRQRSAFWYRQIEGLSGLNQSKVRHRLADVSQSGGDDTGNGETTTKTAGLECRALSARPALLKRFGGNESSELAVERALTWLEKHQNPDGSWNFNHYGPRCKELCANPGMLDGAPNAATSLALLAFLGNGNCTKEGKYRKNVVTGLNYLKRRSVASGMAAALCELKSTHMPSHALATVAFCEAAAMSRDRQLRLASQALVNFLVAAQSTDGGWGDRLVMPQRGSPPSGFGTMLSTAWSLTALRTAQWAGVTVPASTFQQASRFLERTGSYAPDSLDRTLGLYGRFSIDWAPEQLKAGPGLSPTWEPSLNGKWTQNYFQSVLLRQTDDSAWQTWNAAVRDHLIESQSKEGHAAGSWYSDGGDWSDRQGGRMFCTALGALILEAYYRYPPPQ